MRKKPISTTKKAASEGAAFIQYFARNYRFTINRLANLTFFDVTFKM